MKNYLEKMADDSAVFGEGILKNCTMDSLPKRLWGAWMVLCGEAGIVIVRIKPKAVYQP